MKYLSEQDEQHVAEEFQGPPQSNQRKEMTMKTETAFTPGPWQLRPTGAIAGDGEIVVVRFGLNDGFGRLEANARLIAEAPAMFEALTLLVSQFDECKLEFADYPAIANAKAILQRIGGQP